MGYEIRYAGHEPSSRKPGTRLPALTAGFFLAFLLLTHAFWPAGASKLRQLVLPGDSEVTGQAVASLVEDLREGQAVGDAVTTFCREILAHAEYSD